MNDNLLHIGGNMIQIGHSLLGVHYDPYNPYNLPRGTIRFQFEDESVDPRRGIDVGGIWRQVSSSPNVWDWSEHPLGSWSLVRRFDGRITMPAHIIGGNLEGFTSEGMIGCFGHCTGLKTVGIMNTNIHEHWSLLSTFEDCRNLETIAPLPVSGSAYMICSNCTSLKTIPLFENYGITDLMGAFQNCINVESGMLALYERYPNEPPRHYQCFENCGTNTASGMAERELLPSDWK
jgi:hypothetical protein